MNAPLLTRAVAGEDFRVIALTNRTKSGASAKRIHATLRGLCSRVNMSRCGYGPRLYECHLHFIAGRRTPLPGQRRR